MISKLSELSLFLPTYNEEAVIAETISKADEILKKVAKKYEILVVNDGSTDNTAQIVSNLGKQNKHIRMITHDPNKGYGGALKTGLYKSKYKYITFIDSDGQFDFAQINEFIKYVDKFDLIIGYRHNRADHSLRKVIAFLLKVWNLIWFQFWVTDADCAFKLVKKNVISSIPSLKTESAITTTEFLIKAKQAGFKVKEIPVSHYERVGGQSTGSNPKVILRAARDTLKLFWLLKIKKQ